jgi:hypothetical protein
MTPAQPALDAMMEGLPDYDAGLLNDYGGGNVDWWWDYLRAEIGRANDHWRELVPALAAEVRALQACNRGLVRLNEATEARAIKAETEVRAQRETIAALTAERDEARRDSALKHDWRIANQRTEIARLHATIAGLTARVEALRSAGMEALAALVSARDTIRAKTGATNPAREAAIKTWCDILGVYVVPHDKKDTPNG